MAKNLCDTCVQKSIEECDAMYHEVQFYKDINATVEIEKEDMNKVFKCFKYKKIKK